MSTSTATVGYPVHRVTRFRRWTNQHQAHFTDWTAACGVSGTKPGWSGVFGCAGSALRLELCTSCFPGRDMHGYFLDPIEVQRTTVQEARGGE